MEQKESTKNKVIKGVTFLGISNIVMRFISFFSVFLIVRSLSVFEYGIFTLFLSLTGPLNSFVSVGGTDDLMVADVSGSLGRKDLSRAKSIMWHFFRLRFVLLVAALFGIYIFRDLVQEKYGGEIATYFWLFAALVSAQFIRNIYIIILNIYEKFSLLSYINIAEVFFRFMLVAAFFALGKLNIYFLIVAYIFGTSLSALIFTGSVAKIWKSLSGAQLASWKIVYEILKRHGKWQIIAEILSSPVNAIKYWFIKIFISVEAIGLLSLAQSLFSVLASLVPLRAVALPIVVKKAQDKPFFVKLLRKLTKYSMIVHMLIILAAQIIIAPLIPFVFPKYTLAIPIFQLLSLRLLFNSTSITQVAAFLAYQRQKFFTFTTLLVLFSALLFSPPLMLKFGIQGAVAESLISIALVTVAREIYLRKRLRVSTFGLRSMFSIDEADKLIAKEFYLKIKSYLWLPKQS